MFAALLEDCNDEFLACSFATRAFDAVTGVELWHDRFQDVAGADTYPQSLAYSSNRVYVGGGSADLDGNYHWRMRVLDARSGEVLADEGETHAFIGNITAMVAGTGVVFVAGNINDAFTVRAYR